MKKTILMLFCVQIILQSCQNESWKYLGETPPGNIPKVFAPGIVSTEALEHSSPQFTKDFKEFYWSAINFPLNENYKVIYYCEYKDGKWSKRKIAPFSGKDNDDSPLIFDNKIFFSSKRNIKELPDSLKNLHWTLKPNSKILYCNRNESGWVDPEVFPKLPGIAKTMLISISDNGNIYYLGHLKGVKQECGIYVSKKTSNGYSNPELLPESINSVYQDWTPFIASDESYLIYSSTRNQNRSDYGDLFISFKDKNGNWSDPLFMGDEINTPAQERFPYVTPDGKYLFFTRSTEDNSQDIFWVSAEIIQKLKKRNINQ